MKRYVQEHAITGIALMALAGGAAALLVWRLRKRKTARRDAVAAALHLEHTSPESGYSRWSAQKHTRAAGSLGAASR